MQEIMPLWLRDKQRLAAIMKSCNLNIKGAAFYRPDRNVLVSP